jgi:hypothetical protein
MMKRTLNVAILLAAVFIAAACTFTQLAYSNIGLAYNNAAPMLAWMVSDYVDMSDDQKEFVRERFSRAFAWHRTRELPEYHRFFEKVLAQARANINVEEAAVDHGELRRYYHRSVSARSGHGGSCSARSGCRRSRWKRFDKDNRRVVGDATEGPGTPESASTVSRPPGQFIGDVSDSRRRWFAAWPQRKRGRAPADRRYRQSRICSWCRQTAAEMVSGFGASSSTRTWRSPTCRLRIAIGAVRTDRADFARSRPRSAGLPARIHGFSGTSADHAGGHRRG